MPFSAGSFTRLYSWVGETASPPIEIAKLDTQEEDFRTAFNNCVLRDGTGNATAALTATAFIPNGATVPVNGMYLSAANTVALASNTTIRYSVNSTGNHSFAAPSSGTTATITGIANAIVGSVEYPTSAATGGMVRFYDTTNSLSRGGIGGGTTLFPGAAIGDFGLTCNATLRFSANNGTTSHFTLTTAAATFSGTVTGGSFIPTSATVPTNGMYLSAANTLAWSTNSVSRLTLNGTGNFTVPAPTSGVALTVNAVSGTHSVKIDDSASASFNAGYLEVPINTQNTAYTCVLADSGKAIYHSDSTARTYTIPSNASVPYPIGTTLTFVNDASAAVNVTINITTDTLFWAADGSTGGNTLARYGIATALKVTATRWQLSGTGIS